jgi:hypothetical protein
VAKFLSHAHLRVCVAEQSANSFTYKICCALRSLTAIDPMAPSLVETIPASNDTEPLKTVSTLAVSPCCPTEIHSASSTVEQMKHARNPSLQVTADHKIKMLDAPILKPGKGEVLLHVKVTGICG